MLARYKIFRGKPPVDARPPVGIRQDTRKHTRHCLRPPAQIVLDYLDDPTDETWEAFASGYISSLEDRFTADRSPFDALAELATQNDVFLGCSCPTAKNPDVRRCHTILALNFMHKHFPRLKIVLP